MGTTIDVKESIIDEKSEFNIKRFKISELKIERPIKVIDARHVTIQSFCKFGRFFDVKIFESSRLVTVDSVNRILEEGDEEIIKKHFGFRRWFKDYHFVVAVTFKFNPFEEFKDLKQMDGYFKYLYEYSDPFVLVPNLKIEKTVVDGKKRKKVKLINVDRYITYVDNAVEILDYKNDKPIFVPVSLKFGINEIVRLARHYIDKEYLCLWFDFEGSPVTETKVARIRAFLGEIAEKGKFDDVVIYATNIKREIISNIKDDKGPASDVLTSLTGANLIGTNREPPRPIEPNIKWSKKELREHKARIFDRNSYYYFKVLKTLKNKDEMKRLLFNQNYNALVNSKLLDKEFEAQTSFFLERHSIKEYISQKQMIREFKNGELLKCLFYSETKLTDWY